MKLLTRAVLFVAMIASLCVTAQAQQVSVSAADYSRNLAPGTITAAFGVEMSASVEAAATLPLPTKLAGTRVLVNGKAAPLFFVSPSQINYLLPEDTPTGNVEVVIERDGTVKSRETIQMRSAAFTMFTRDQSGSGEAALLDGRTYKTGPFKVHTSTGEQTILALFGTGLGDAGSTSTVSNRLKVFVGGIEAKVHYAGPQPGFAGLSQINFELPDAIDDHGTLPLMVKIDNEQSNPVTVEVESLNTANVSVALSNTETVSLSDATPIPVSPFQDIDSLKVTVRTFNLVTDKGVEVALLSAPLTVDLLTPEGFARLIRVGSLKAGTYVSISGEISEVKASYKGADVRMTLANKNLMQKLKEPFKLERDARVGVSLAFDLRASVRKQLDGSYVFDPVLLLSRILPVQPLVPVVTVSGKITEIKSDTKVLKVQRGDNSSVQVNAANASIIGEDGKPATFAALKVDQKVDASGQLDDKGVVNARVIQIGGFRPPPIRSAFVTGEITAVDKTNSTFDISVESFAGPQVTKPAKLTIKWNSTTKFVDDIKGFTNADSLAVGLRAQVNIPDYTSPFLASNVLTLHPRITGTVQDTAGLPASFVVNVFDPRILSPTAPVRLVTVNLKATTRIRNIFGEAQKPENITAGTQVDVLAESLSNNQAVAEAIVITGINLMGQTSPDTVNTTAKTFVLTLEGSGRKVSVSLEPHATLYVAGPRALPAPMLVEPFLNALKSKAWRANVFGLPGADGKVRALVVMLIDNQ